MANHFAHIFLVIYIQFKKQISLEWVFVRQDCAIEAIDQRWKLTSDESTCLKQLR